MIKKIALCIFIVVALFCGILGILLCKTSSYAKSFSDFDVQLMRIKLYGSSEVEDGSTVSANIAVLNQLGQEIAVIERSWPEPYLCVSFDSCRFCGTTFFFPRSIYGSHFVNVKKSLFHKGSFIKQYYMENGECLLNSGKFEKKALYAISKFALKRNAVSLASLETGRYYGIFAKGGKLFVIAE